MLTSEERRALFAYCRDDLVGVCPRCGEHLGAVHIAADIVGGERDFCPGCRADLAAALRNHLAECTWIRVQAREARARAQASLTLVRETTKESRQLRDQADVLRREAEAARDESQKTKRGWPLDGGKELRQGRTR